MEASILVSGKRDMIMLYGVDRDLAVALEELEAFRSERTGGGSF